MIIPYPLKRVIHDACCIVERHPQHDLPLGYRHAIYANLGPPLGTCQDNTRHKRRTVLAFLTVQHVLPLWEKARPHDDTPHQILLKVEEVMLSWKEGNFDAQSAQREAGQFWNYMDGVALETGGKDPVEVGYAAVEALHTAVADEEFDPSAIDYSLTDEDVDAYGHDTAFAAAADYAGGATWMPNSDASKRREFWHWWRAFAIPAAWWAVWQPERGALQHILTAPSASQARQRQRQHT